MTAAAVPLSNGVPDQGAEGHRFMGIALYDQLMHWDLSKADGPATLRPGLATTWKVDPANPKRWLFTLRLWGVVRRPQAPGAVVGWPGWLPARAGRIVSPP